MFITHDHEKMISLLQEFSIIVEGKNDKSALEKLGIQKIYTISGKTIEKFTSELPKDEYVILTDFDREGELKKQRIYRLVENNKIKYNPELRLKFKELFKVVKIEELNKISKIMEDVQNGKNSSIYNKILNRSRFYRRRFS
ncbi:MAG: toprim domain-containing protein [Candidatus Aenigmarchaeota archaeon]|nr:toprim domain-containing protein [Candidatus Aenigmarchaeota archaeon]